MSAVLAAIDDGSPAALPPERLLAWLGAYEKRVAALAGALCERECRRLGVPLTPGARRTWYGAREVWLGSPAPLSSFATHANRLALLDEGGLRRVLAAVRLYASRGALRRVVSGAQRRAMAGAVGEQAFGVLLQLGLQAPWAGTALPDQMNDSVLAAGGHAMIAADGALTLDLAARLVSLTLPQEPAGQQHAAQAGDAPGARTAPSAAPGESTRFLASASLIFPEFTWLFG